MGIILNNDKHKVTGSHLRLSLLMFLGVDVAQRETTATKIVNTLQAFARDTLGIELVGEMFQADSRVSAYDKYRAAGISHADALDRIARAKEDKELQAKGEAILKQNAA